MNRDDDLYHALLWLVLRGYHVRRKSMVCIQGDAMGLVGSWWSDSE